MCHLCVFSLKIHYLSFTMQAVDFKIISLIIFVTFLFLFLCAELFTARITRAFPPNPYFVLHLTATVQNVSSCFLLPKVGVCVLELTLVSWLWLNNTPIISCCHATQCMMTHHSDAFKNKLGLKANIHILPTAHKTICQVY